MRKLIVFLFFLICNEFYSQATVDLDVIIGKSQSNLVGDSIRLEVNTYKAFKKMEAAAKRDGIYLKIVSAYRGFERQKLIWNNKYEKFTNDFSLEPEKAISEIIRFSTVPGTSRHHWGTDIDIIDGNFPDEENVLVSEKFEKDGLFYKVKNWLDNNSENFGFYLTYTNDKNRKGFEFEPWHYSYKPVSVKYYRALIKTDLKKIIKSLDINGSDYFDESFIDAYIAENIMDINPDLK
ncbi:MAG: M15 family metallopeptidase [Bacteroidota bacterium]